MEWKGEMLVCIYLFKLSSGSSCIFQIGLKILSSITFPATIYVWNFVLPNVPYP